MRCARDYMLACFKGVPLLPLYMRGVGLQGRFPNRLRVGVLVGYNCISCYTRKIGSYPYTAGSFLQSCVANSPDGVRLHSVGPTHPVRVSTLWASSWVSRGNIPHTRLVINKYISSVAELTYQIRISLTVS